MTATVEMSGGYLNRAFFTFRQGVSRSEMLMASVVQSYAPEGKTFSRGYKKLAETYKVSDSTLSRSFNNLESKGLIKRKRNVGGATEYTYVHDEEAKEKEKSSKKKEKGLRSIRTEEYFYSIKIKIEGIERFLTKAEIDVLSFIYTYTRWKKAGKFVGSFAYIAKKLCMSEGTVCRALRALINAELIIELEKGCNRYKKGEYITNDEKVPLVMYKTKAEEPTESKVVEAVVERYTQRPLTEEQRQYLEYKERQERKIEDLNAKTDRERYYSELKQGAEDAAKKLVADIQRKEPRYKQILLRLNQLEIALAKAEVYDVGNLQEVQREKRSTILQRDEILRRFGLTVEDLAPRWRCSKCSDSGYLSDGRACDCYRPSVKKSGRKEK